MTRDTFLPFSPPSIGQEEIDEVVDTLRSDWITTGPKVRRFEESFAEYVGAAGALAVSSCTDALHTALMTLGVGTGDAVVTTPMTFASTVHVIEHTGARPVLVDVQPDTLNIDPQQVEAALDRGDERVTALLPVHLYGHPCDMDALVSIARDRGLALVEDAAHALPAAFEGTKVGSDGYDGVSSLTAFSFYATKNLSTAEGGMLTGPPELLEEARVWSLHGMSRDAWRRYSDKGSWFYEITKPGFKYNMTDIQAALGLHQLTRLAGFQQRRQAIVDRYNEAFAQLDALELPTHRPNVEHAWHLYAVRLRKEALTIGRDEFIAGMNDRNIGVSVHFIPIHVHPYYRDKYGWKPDHFPIAFDAYERIVSLPLYPRMSDRDVDDVIEAVNAVIGSHRR
jgi:dTDP-4-amino-4,6-dideoxygalactose transaminase